MEVNPASADVYLYQLGNNQLHREVYRQALRQPGVSVIHDAVLQHFFLGSLSEQEYIEEFQYNYGAWSRDLARALWRGRARSATDPKYFEYPLLRRIAEVSRALVVHNPAAAKMVREHAPDAKIVEIPHLWERPELPAGHAVERLRRQLGCDSQTLLCGVFGHLRESKRIATILRVLERLRQDRRVALVLAGEFVSSDLRRGLEMRLGGAGIVHTGYLSEQDFWLHAAAVDVCINLRYPAAGETSGIAIRLMGLGKPVILTAGLETSGFPDTACLRVDPGGAEEEMLLEYLNWASGHPADLNEIGRRAATHVQAKHALVRVARLYRNTLEDCSHEADL